MLFRRSPRVRPLATIGAPALPWRSEGVLVLVEHGLGKLRWAADPLCAEGARRILMLDRVPLLTAQADEYWCPTCEKLLAMGAGREHVAASALEALRKVSSPSESPLSSALEGLAPLLSLLKDGVYLISRVRHSPTNGEGLPFWALDRRPRRFAASRDWYFGGRGAFRLAAGFPAFLVATQALDRSDWGCVEHYREQLRNGVSIGGLAYWAEGFVSALLDGHHRATAALLEGVPLECLTIVEVGAVALDDGKRSLWVWDARVPFDRLPGSAVRVLQQPRDAPLPEFPGHASDDEGPPPRAWEAHPRWSELARASTRFPSALAVAALEVAGDTSEDRIERLLAGGEQSGPELWLVLQALIASNDPRALKVALRVGRGHWPDLWQDAFEFLATQRLPAVEDFFVDYLVADEGMHPHLRRVADAYLSVAPAAPEGSPRQR